MPIRSPSGIYETASNFDGMSRTVKQNKYINITNLSNLY